MAQRFVLAATLIFPILIAGGCWLDGTLVMADPAKGLRQHYGYWALFVTAPIVIYLAAYLFDTFSTSVRKTDGYCTGLTRETNAQLERLIKRHLQSLSLHYRTVWILVFIVFVAFSLWLLNIVNTISPAGTYLHDVFDAYHHTFGFYTTKAYLLVVFVAYGTAIFVALHVTYSMISILKFLRGKSALAVNFFHSDNCGGTSQFGNINLIILTTYANFFAVICAMYLTHRHTYLVMTGSLIACSILAVVQSIGAVWFIHKTVALKKRETIEAVTAKLNAQFASSVQGEHFREDQLAFRNHLMGIRTFPYAAGALIAVNVIRFAPAALAIVGYVKKFP